jgi:hypothetical protein
MRAQAVTFLVIDRFTTQALSITKHLSVFPFFRCNERDELSCLSNSSMGD